MNTDICVSNPEFDLHKSNVHCAIKAQSYGQYVVLLPLNIRVIDMRRFLQILSLYGSLSISNTVFGAKSGFS